MKKVTLAIIIVMALIVVSGANAQKLTAPLARQIAKLFPGESPDSVWKKVAIKQLGKDAAKITYRQVKYNDADTTYDPVAKKVYKNGRVTPFVVLSKDDVVLSYNNIVFGKLSLNESESVCLEANTLTVKDYTVLEEKMKKERKEQEKIVAQQQLAQQRYEASLVQQYANNRNAYVASGGSNVIFADQRINGVQAVHPRRYVDLTSSNSSNGIYETPIWTATNALGTSCYRELNW